jgi:hypothetical protein
MSHAWLINWQDIVEIGCLGTIFYYFSLWLKQDTQKPLIGYFYTYLGFLILAYNIQLTTLYTFALVMSPVTIMLFIIMHQHTLQKNFVTLRNTKTTVALSSTNWLEALLRTCLITSSHNKELICLIEHNDAVQPYITCPELLHIELRNNVLTLITESSTYDPTKIIWVTSKGTLVGVNGTLQLGDTLSFSQETEAFDALTQQAIALSGKTDALLLRIHAGKQLGDLIIQGKILPQMSAHSMLKLIQKYIGAEQFIAAQKGDHTHELAYKKNRFTQHNP